jgi:outer membrane protein
MKRAFARTAAAVALATLMLGGASFAQEPSPSPSPIPETPNQVLESTPPTQAAAGTVDAPDRPTLELSLQDAVERAMKNNVDIAVQAFDPRLSDEAIRNANGVYDPLVTSQVIRVSNTERGTGTLSGVADTLTSSSLTYDFGASKLLESGGTFDLSFNNRRFATNSIFNNPNPSFSSGLDAQLTQPLLRNFRIDSFRYNVRVAKKNREISDVQFKQTVVNTIANVKQLYNNLLGTIDNLSATRKSLDLAKKLLNENEIKVKVGTMAPLDVVAAESEVASREEGVIVAEALVADAEDAIKSAIFPQSEPQMWAYRVVPTDRPTAEPLPISIDTALANALQNRTDMQTARKNLENADYEIDFTGNQLKPRFDLVAGYGVSGLGGTTVVQEPVPGAPEQPPAVQFQPGFGGALDDLFSLDFPTWTVGVNFAFPIGNRQAKASNARARISKDQALASLRRLELTVASQVRAAGRAVETNFKRVDSTRAARVLAERRLDAEQKRFNAGMSTNFLVTQAQRDLSVAEVSEIQAIADYRNSVVNFERVQEAGTTGVSFVGSSSSSSSSTSSQ